MENLGHAAYQRPDGYDECKRGHGIARASEDKDAHGNGQQSANHERPPGASVLSSKCIDQVGALPFQQPSVSVLFSQPSLIREVPREFANLRIVERFCHCAHNGILTRALTILCQRLHEVVIFLGGQARRFRRDWFVAARSVTRFARGRTFWRTSSWIGAKGAWM